MTRSQSLHPGGVRQLVQAEQVVSVLLLVGVAGVMMAQVIARYVFDTPIVWSEEFARLGLIWLTFVASGFVMSTGEHIQVDVIGNFVGRRGRLFLDLFSAAVVLVTTLMLLPQGLQFVAARSGSTSPMMGMPMDLWYAAVPVGFVLLAFHSTLNIVLAISRGKAVWDRNVEAGVGDGVEGTGA